MSYLEILTAIRISKFRIQIFFSFYASWVLVNQTKGQWLIFNSVSSTHFSTKYLTSKDTHCLPSSIKQFTGSCTFLYCHWPFASFPILDEATWSPNQETGESREHVFLIDCFQLVTKLLMSFAWLAGFLAHSLILLYPLLCMLAGVLSLVNAKYKSKHVSLPLKIPQNFPIISKIKAKLLPHLQQAYMNLHALDLAYLCNHTQAIS